MSKCDQTFKETVLMQFSNCHPADCVDKQN